MRLSRFVLVTILLIAGAQFVPAQTCNRHVEPQGGFSICIPDGWNVREQADAKFKALFGPPADNFAPNINIRDGMSTASLSDYVADGIKTILANAEKIGADSIEPLGQSDFDTDSGLHGIRVVFQSNYKGFLARTIQYIFDAGNGRKLIVTGTGLEKNKEVFDRVYDRAVKSFRLQ